jgi:hypothetical protein
VTDEPRFLGKTHGYVASSSPAVAMDRLEAVGEDEQGRPRVAFGEIGGSAFARTPSARSLGKSRGKAA